jgi:hypothetical protein
MAQDTLNHHRVLDRGDEPQAAAARACEHIDGEDAPEQLGPGEVAPRWWGGARAVVNRHRRLPGCVPVAVVGYSRSDRARPPARVRCEDAMVEEQVDPGARDESREFLPELEVQTLEDGLCRVRRVDRREDSRACAAARAVCPILLPFK